MAKPDREGAPAPSEPRVGYGSPPKEHRFREGSVPNPYGRNGKPKPKAEFLDELVRVRIDGRWRKISRDAALDHALYKEAMGGSVAATKELEARRLRRLAATAGEAPADRLPPDQEAALLRALQRSAGRRTPEPADGDGRATL